jgi:hypothetical protein
LVNSAAAVSPTELKNGNTPTGGITKHNLFFSVQVHVLFVKWMVVVILNGSVICKLAGFHGYREKYKKIH